MMATASVCNADNTESSHGQETSSAAVSSAEDSRQPMNESDERSPLDATMGTDRSNRLGTEVQCKALQEEMGRNREEQRTTNQERSGFFKSQEETGTRHAQTITKKLYPREEPIELEHTYLHCENTTPLLEAPLRDSRNVTSRFIRTKEVHHPIAAARPVEVEVLTDAQFVQNFRALVSAVRSLSRQIHSGDGNNIVGLLGVPELLSNVSAEHWKGRARTKRFVEAWMWFTLIAQVFRDTFQKFGKSGEGLAKSWIEMFGQEHDHGWPIPSIECETWRLRTMDYLAACSGLALISINQQDRARNISNNTDSTARATVTHHIHQRIQKIRPEMDLSSVRSIVDKAFALAKHMSSQQSRLQITYPSTGMLFDQNNMLSVSDIDSEEDEKGLVAFVVNPGLTKWGDAQGRYLDERLDIVRALVQVEDES